MKNTVKAIKARKTERIYTPVSHVIDFLHVLEAHGEKTVFTYRSAGKEYHLSYGDFYRRVLTAVNGLKTYNLAGKRVAIIGETRPEWYTVYLAVLATGGVAIPMDKELAPEEVANFLTVAKADALAYTNTIGDKIPTDGHPTLKARIPFDSTAEELCIHEDGVSVVPFASLTADDSELVCPDAESVDVDAMCEMLFTSGTTGTSKCVMLSQKNIFSTVTAACESVPFTPDDVILSVLPIHHTYELACSIAAMNYGVHICINDSLRRVLPNIQKYRPTGLVLVPLFVETMHKKIFAEAKKQGRDKTLRTGLLISGVASKLHIDLRAQLFKAVQQSFGGRLEKIICGGAALNPRLIRDFEEFGIHVYEGYGITECSPLIAVTPYYARKYGSVGPAVPSCSARISGDALGEHGFIEGEIQVKGTNVMLGYYGNAEANADAFTEDGWYRTGDVGYMDDDGYIYITGRIKSVIVLENGKNVFPEEIEEYLGAIEEIQESVVVGRKAENGDAIVLTAIVFPDRSKFPKEATDEEIEETIRKAITAQNRRLPSFKQIHKVEFRDTEFEKTTSRKIKRHLVK